MKTLLYSTLVALAIVTFAFAQASTNSSASSNGDIALNNVISMAIGNAIQSGDFKTVQLTSTDLSAAANSCRRRSYTVNLANPSSFPGKLRSVYDSGVIRIGVSSIHNSSAFFSFDNNEGSGYLADVSRIMVSHLSLIIGKNIQPEFVPYNVESDFFEESIALLGGANANSVDTIIDVTYLVSRLNRTDFTCAYEAAIPFAVFRNENSPLPPALGATPPSTLEAWNNAAVRVATVRGSVYAAAADKYLPLAQKVFFSSSSEAFEAVGTQADITFYDIASLAVFNSTRNNATALTVQPGTEILFAGGTGFITHKGQ